MRSEGSTGLRPPGPKSGYVRPGSLVLLCSSLESLRAGEWELRWDTCLIIIPDIFMVLTLENLILI